LWIDNDDDDDDDDDNLIGLAGFELLRIPTMSEVSIVVGTVVVVDVAAV
jgi:hypothetical protein